MHTWFPDHFWHLLGPLYGSSLALVGPFWGPEWDQKRVILGWFRIIFGSIRVILWPLGIILASFWHHFWVVLASFWPHFEAFLVRFWPFWGCFWDFLGQNPGHFGGFGPQQSIETQKRYFEEDTQRYRSVKEPGQTDMNSSRYGRSWCQKGQFI